MCRPAPARRYDGNLLDLVQPYGFKDAPADRRYDNRALDGFMDRFVENGCRGRD